VCVRQSGYRAGQYCTNTVDDQLRTQNRLKGCCLSLAPGWYILSPDAKRYQVTGNCERPENILNKSWFVLPPSMEYYYKTKNYQYHVLPPFIPGCGEADYGNPMELIYPKENAKIYVPLEADGKRGRVVFNAAHRQPGIKIFWHLDDKYAGETSTFHQMALNPSPGKHRLTLVDGSGNTISINFEVLDKNK
jgi:penicillin-binding protein 1C